MHGLVRKSCYGRLVDTYSGISINGHPRRVTTLYKTASTRLNSLSLTHHPCVNPLPIRIKKGCRILHLTQSLLPLIAHKGEGGRSVQLKVYSRISFRN